MIFAIMEWIGEGTKSGSVFGIIDKDNPGTLPTITEKGHWAQYRLIDEGRFKFASEARASIAKLGYYLMGGKVEPKEILDSKYPPTQLP